MITVKQFLEATGYLISGGSDYGWDCYGPYARHLDCEPVPVKGTNVSASAVFDSITKEVYQVSVYDYGANRAYRLFGNPDHQAAFNAEAEERESNARDAWEGVNYVDLETVEDFVEKCSAIFNGKEYDDRVSVPLDIEDDLLHELMLRAHKEDVTLNQLVEKILRNMVDELQGQGNGASTPSRG